MKTASLLAAGVALSLGACTHLQPAPQAPAQLQPPAGQALLFSMAARGAQVYECTQKDGKAAWTFKGPEAELINAAGRRIGIHYGGPTWESPDGSKVVAKLVASAPAPDAGAIPLLLLEARSTGKDGTFAPVRSIQRLETTGGIAPKQPCGDANRGARMDVAYTATYYFYGDAR